MHTSRTTRAPHRSQWRALPESVRRHTSALSKRWDARRSGDWRERSDSCNLKATARWVNAMYCTCLMFYDEYLETCKQKAFLLCATARESSADRSDKTTCDNQGNHIGRAFLLKQEHTVHGILCHKCQIMPFCKYLNICLQHTYLVFNIFGLQHEGNLANTVYT